MQYVCQQKNIVGDRNTRIVFLLFFVRLLSGCVLFFFAQKVEQI